MEIPDYWLKKEIVLEDLLLYFFATGLCLSSSTEEQAVTSWCNGSSDGSHMVYSLSYILYQPVQRYIRFIKTFQVNGRGSRIVSHFYLP